ncbi:MAG TPA: 30S ribosomal protein S14 [Rhabdochlamydiaceae bacterium]|nr:30S ribosomal protein S14 [Rhabdochlamydiaceae bacterium]
MATAALKAKLRKQKRLVDLKWKQRQELKKIVRSLDKSEDERLEAQNKLNRLPKNSSPVRVHNRCNLTGRARGYLRKFQLSRLCFRELANAGMIPGVTKASW